MIYLLCLANLVGLALYWQRLGATSLRRVYFTLFVSCYVFTYFGGLLLARILFSYFGIDKISASDATSRELVLLAQACLLLFLLGYFIAAPVRRLLPKRAEIDWRLGTKGFVQVLTTAFTVSMLIYLASSGGPVLLKEGGYENRYDANVGMGGYSLFFSMGLVACTLAALRARTRREKVHTIVATVLYCALTFVVLGGYRQLGFAALFSIAVIAVLRKDISFRSFIAVSGALITITLAVAIFRYTGTTSDETGGVAGRLFIFLYDGFAPVDAFYNIVDFCRRHEVTENVFLNQLTTPIPRFLWHDKPAIVLNAGNYYTQVVLGRTDLITYSPTILGELYLLGGGVACAVGSLVSGVILRTFDEVLIRSKRKLVVAFLSSFSFVFVFNLYREGIEVLVTKTILFGGAVAVLWLATELLTQPRRSAQ
ncbi:WzyE family oligosaccharide polymerase [Caballeronia grimmiae]|uniref:Oligosaccharide repeat unit polymerase n=1 Tax=Caballeronia grimmiae TaxID=1071679 RepID=A0A069P5N5_9BURK|nr:WzyE family oligosaccharide polymerase [Caballeronia grimmiae]KDR35995.1 hypothetical protein BG57_25335 [Caballeronia grimmiae]GGD87407.1 hypothetical protein GCM10010985_47500 [Caballeronia grimmiae]